jgi:hypothetical protein
MILMIHTLLLTTIFLFLSLTHSTNSFAAEDAHGTKRDAAAAFGENEEEARKAKRLCTAADLERIQNEREAATTAALEIFPTGVFHSGGTSTTRKNYHLRTPENRVTVAVAPPAPPRAPKGAYSFSLTPAGYKCRHVGCPLAFDDFNRYSTHVGLCPYKHGIPQTSVALAINEKLKIPCEGCGKAIHPSHRKRHDRACPSRQTTNVTEPSSLAASDPAESVNICKGCGFKAESPAGHSSHTRNCKKYLGLKTIV